MFSNQKHSTPSPTARQAAPAQVSLLDLCQCALRDVFDHQEDIEDLGDRSTGSEYESPLFIPLASILRRYSFTKAQVREWMLIAAEDFPGVDDLQDCYGHVRDFVDWLDESLRRIDISQKDPTAAGLQALAVGVAPFGRWKSSGRPKNPTACLTLSFLAGASALRAGKPVGFGERQMAALFGLPDRKTINDAVKRLVGEGLLRKTEEHVFVAVGSPENRVTRYELAWERLPSSFLAALGEISTFCRKMLEYLLGPPPPVLDRLISGYNLLKTERCQDRGSSESLPVSERASSSESEVFRPILGAT